MSVSAAQSARVRWADTAKGVCILLVVLWHVVAKQYLRLDWPAGLRVPGAWGTLCELLLPLRMPLFFTISGMFALGAVNRPWRVSARSRVAKFLYLYVVWLLIHTALLSLTPDFPTDRATSPLGLLEQLTITPSNLWYLFALAVYFVIAKATWRVPRAVMLSFALALSIAASAELIPVPGNRAGLLQNLVFFLAGLYFRPYVERLAAGANWTRLALVTGVYGAALVAMVATGTQDVPGVWPAVCVAAAAFGVVGSAMLARWDLVANPLVSIGRRTLPIYVIHMPLLALLDLVLARPLSAAGGLLQVLLAVFEPILMTALIAWVCLLLHRGLEAAKISRFLLDLPGGGKGGARPAPTPSGSPEHGTAPAVPDGAPTPPQAAGFPVPEPFPAPQHTAWPAGFDTAAAPSAVQVTHRPAGLDTVAAPPAPQQPAQDAFAWFPAPAAAPAPYQQAPSTGPVHQQHAPFAAPGPAPAAPAVPYQPGENAAYPARQPAHPGAHTGSHHPGATGPLPYPAQEQAGPVPAYPAGTHPADLPTAPLARHAQQQGTHPADHQPGSRPQGSPPAARPAQQQPGPAPAHQPSTHPADLPTTPLGRPASWQADPASAATRRPVPDQLAWPKPAEQQATPQQPPADGAGSAAWFDVPQSARRTSWSPGTAAATGEHASGVPTYQPPATVWSWSQGSDATRPTHRDHTTDDPRS